MGRNPGGNDGNVPPDGDRTPDPDLPGLPELPPEWGEISIPDDLSELASEAEQIREELTRAQQPADERLPGRGPGGTEPSIGVPLLIMSVAVLITLVSLFAMAWSGTGAVAPDTVGSRPAAGDRPAELPPIVLFDAAGRRVTLAAQAPIAIMLVEECGCAGLISATVGVAPPGVTVAIVGYTAPPMPTNLAPGDQVPIRLADPDGLVRTRLGLDRPTDTATVVLVDQGRRITHIQPAATSVAPYQGALTDLAGS
jgi:hypothetical protein